MKFNTFYPLYCSLNKAPVFKAVTWVNRTGHRRAAIKQEKEDKTRKQVVNTSYYLKGSKQLLRGRKKYDSNINSE